MRAIAQQTAPLFPDRPEHDPTQKPRRPEHASLGDPCALCAAPARAHRAPRGPRATAYHAPNGDPCGCGLPASKHRPQEARDKRKAYDAEREEPRSAPKKERLIVGVDGEGQDTPDGRHVYTYLAAVDELGVCVAEAYNVDGLSHDQCAEMILSIPQNTLRFGFMFSYDVTKIIEEMPELDRFRLLRPNTRNAHKCRACEHPWDYFAAACPECGSDDFQTFTRSLRWRGRSYGFFNGSFSISARRADPADKARPWLARKSNAKRTVKIWDCFRFFGCAFTEALRNWKIASKPAEPWFQLAGSKKPDDLTTAEIDAIAKMKAQRGEFATVDPEAIKAYCRAECHLLALLMRKVIDSHDKAEIPLTSYYGAGSTAGALLKKNSVGDYKGPRLSEMRPELAHAVSSAFFGGRFENSTIGTVSRPVHSYDISSAYPYALAPLPCLSCGRWRHVPRPTLRQIERAALALCKFRVAPLTTAARAKTAWCPLPFRDKKGSIAYGCNFTGWGWRAEVMSAIAGWGFVKLEAGGPSGPHGGGGAWLYDTDCDHRPFAFIPDVYRKRCEWGKEGPGIVLKLGINAGYGKTAQSIGDNPPYQAWPWAGNTTAGTRGQLNDAIASADDPWSVLAVATDGIFSTEALELPAPRSTGTGDLKKPLGGWEHKEIPEGAFLAKPGLYFRLAAELADIRARGVGRREVFEQRAALEASFGKWDRVTFDHHVVMTSRRFFGAKHSISAYSGCTPCGAHWPGVPSQGCPKCGKVGDRCATTSQTLEDGRPAYGTWSVRRSEVRFDPRPKREAVSMGGPCGRLMVRDLGGQVSAPYLVGETTPEGQNARTSTEFALEQPEWEESRFTA